MRKCEVCRAELRLRRGEKVSNFRARRTCSESCAQELRVAHRRGTTPARDCPVCGERLVRRPNEKLCDFRRRQTCGRVCGHALLAKGWGNSPEASVLRLRYRGEPIAERAFRLLERYGGIPLSVAEVADELKVSTGGVRAALGRLYREGRVERRENPDQSGAHLYSLPERLEAAA